MNIFLTSLVRFLILFKDYERFRDISLDTYKDDYTALKRHGQIIKFNIKLTVDLCYIKTNLDLQFNFLNLISLI